MSTLKTFIALPLFLLAFGVRAQGEGSYEIQGVYTPTIFDAQKIDLRPQPIDTVLPDLPVRYDLLPAKADIPARVDSLEAAKLKVEATQQRLYKGFVKAGFGLYTTPLGELYYDQTRSRENGFGIHLKHMSSNGGLDDVGPSDYSFNNIDGFYKHFLPEHEASGRLLYDRRRVSYYGYASNDSIEDAIDALSPEDDQLQQFYNDIGFAARIRSLYADSSKIAHDIGMEVHSYSNLSESRETNFRVTAEVGKQERTEYFSAGLLIDNNAYRAQRDGSGGEDRQNGVLLGLTPSVRTVGQKYFVRLGVGMYLDAMDETTFHFFPQVYAHYGLFNNILVPYAGLEGTRQRNSFRSLTRQNPWLGGGPPLANTSQLYDVYLGLRGSFANNLGFDVRASKSAYSDMALFANVPNLPYGDRMAVLYDDVDILDLSGEITYSRYEELRFSARVDIYTYDVKVQDEPWNLPPYKLTFATRYTFRDKLIVKAEALFMGERPAFRAPEPSDDPNAPNPAIRTELDGYLDLYLGLEYRYTKRLSLFVDMSNLSASKYERWFRLPVQRGLILGGATYAF